MEQLIQENPGFFLPGLACKDPLAEYWVSQAMLRLRREITWLRHLAGVPANVPVIPPPLDDLSVHLNMRSFLYEKIEFFKNDKTARYLTEKIEAAPPENFDINPGSLSDVAQRLKLEEFDLFVLGLVLLSRLDHTAGKIIASVLNDANKILPTPALAQSLWDQPEAAVRLLTGNYALYRYGLLRLMPGQDHVWDRNLQLSPLVVGALIGQKPAVSTIMCRPDELSRANLQSAPVFASLNRTAQRLMLIPLHGKPGTDYEDFLEHHFQGKIIVVTAGSANFSEPGTLYSLLGAAWLQEAALYIDPAVTYALFQEKNELANTLAALAALPVKLIGAFSDKSLLKTLGSHLYTAGVEIPSMGHQERCDFWNSLLPEGVLGEEVIVECARRFRFEKKSIKEIAADLREQKRTIQKEDLFNSCKAQLKINMGELAQKVSPRFSGEELVLPAKEKEQFHEVITAMRALATVHHEWGIGKVWESGGLSLLFSGPPGTGKTMASELIAEELGLPLYRIDLSQVVNKYIGETEKNLKRLFDAAEQTEAVLFFDEADSIFGKRTEVKDAHDRYANLEVSYLLERIERFQGMAILATNRKNDMDGAFLRRLRYSIQFPFPGEEERLKIWKQVLPKSKEIDTSDLDFSFLAKKIALSGGHIRSIVYNASLQCAGRGLKKLTMESLLTAARRTYEKINQPLNAEIFSGYSKSKGAQS